MGRVDKVILHYTFDDEPFDYEVDWDVVEKELYERLLDCSQEELIKYILSNDGCTINLSEDFKEEIHEIFEGCAEDFYYECKNSDDGVDQKDFV